MEVRESGSALGAPVSVYRLHINNSTSSKRAENNEGCCVFMSIGTPLCSCHYSIGSSAPYMAFTLYWVILGLTVHEDVCGFYSVQIACHVT